MNTKKEQEQYAGDVEFELRQLETIVEAGKEVAGMTYETGSFLSIMCC